MAGICLATTAQAVTAFSAGAVNMHAGPDTAYPLVTVVPQDATLELTGCLDHQSWCDVAYGGKHGWVYGERLLFTYRGRKVLVPEAAKPGGIATVTFNFDAYWKRHYTSSPWWGQYNRWQYYVPHPRVGWGAPPPGIALPTGPGPQNSSRLPGAPPPPQEPASPTLFSGPPRPQAPPKAGEPGYMPSIFDPKPNNGLPWRPPADSWEPPLR